MSAASEGLQDREKYNTSNIYAVNFNLERLFKFFGLFEITSDICLCYLLLSFLLSFLLEFKSLGLPTSIRQCSVVEPRDGPSFALLPTQTLDIGSVWPLAALEITSDLSTFFISPYP